jgi:hypothetical protein
MLIDSAQYAGVLFVHIPKTAGTSITKLLKDNNLDNWNRSWPRHHDPYSHLKETNTIDDSIFSFSVVRNPYTRTYSCFKQYNKANETDISFAEYLNNIFKKIISPVSPLLHIAQSFYVFEDNKLQINKLYRFENLNDFEKDFGWTLGNYNVGNYNIDSYLKDYTEEAVQMTKELYSVDFSLLDYSLDFSKSLELK